MSSEISIVVGSHRQNSNSAKVARFIENTLLQGHFASKVNTLELAKEKLPLWDEGVWSGAQSWKDVWSPIADKLRRSSGFVFIAPEYAGMVPPALKNFLLLCSHQEVGHKAALIVAVSSGRGGSYPVVELRQSSYKNNRINWIPEHVIVRDADHVLNSESPESDSDVFVRSALLYNLRLLVEYSKALSLVRESGVVDFKSFPNGM